MMEHAVCLSGANKTGDVIGQTRSQARALTDCLLPIAGPQTSPHARVRKLFTGGKRLGFHDSAVSPNSLVGLSCAAMLQHVVAQLHFQFCVLWQALCWCLQNVWTALYGLHCEGITG